MAFLVLLERLTRIERAVFLLREVFEYEYSEVAKMVARAKLIADRSWRRARQHVSAMRPRFEVPEPKRTDLFERFQRQWGPVK